LEGHPELTDADPDSHSIQSDRTTHSQIFVSRTSQGAWSGLCAGDAPTEDHRHDNGQQSHDDQDGRGPEKHYQPEIPRGMLTAAQARERG
jgi:hypothetical protein